MTDKVVKAKAVAKAVERQAGDYLMWVGYSNYPTVEAFAREAEVRGVCKRISRVPKNFVLGQSHIFLAHDEGIRGEAVIFGVFAPGQIQVIVPDGTTQVPTGLKWRLGGVDAACVDWSEADGEAPRGCGKRDEICTIYSVSKGGATSTLEYMYARHITMRGCLAIFNEPRDYAAIIDTKCRRFRAMKQVDAGAIIDGPTRGLPTASVEPVVKLEIERPGPGASWTPEEDTLLLRAVQICGSAHAGLREVVRATNRSFPAAAYRLRKLHGTKAQMPTREEEDKCDD